MPALTRQMLVERIIEWNRGSTTPIPGVEWKEEKSIRYGNSRVSMNIESSEDAVGIQTIVPDGEDNSRWSTEFVLNTKENILTVCVDRLCSSKDTMVKRRVFAPKVLSDLIDDGLIRDGERLFLSKPLLMGEKEAEFVSDILTGRRKYSLPVVYLSRNELNELTLDPENVMAQLKGCAVFIIQQDESTNRHLKKLTDCNNPYGGAGKILFPDGSYRKLFPSGYGKIDPADVIISVHRYWRNRSLEGYTFNDVRVAVMKENSLQKAIQIAEKDRAHQEEKELLESQKDALSKEVDEVYSTFDSEVGEKEREIAKHEERVASLQKELDAKEAEILGLKKKLESKSEIPLLYYGEEGDIYVGEIKDLVMKAITEYSKNVSGRREKIFMDILDSNGGYQGLADDRIKRLKTAFRSGGGLTPALRKELTSLGFDIIDDGKHYKLVYGGDSRYFTSLSRTPSDVRSGKNAVTYIINSMM